ncbi:hypothetical protein [Catenulispora rubra]|nr:hypothetical protein [Catenulispora rubra]
MRRNVSGRHAGRRLIALPWLIDVRRLRALPDTVLRLLGHIHVP